MKSAQKQSSNIAPSLDEKVLVVESKHLFQKTEHFSGFKMASSFESYEASIEKHKQFLCRSLVENDSTYKQICPYLIFKHKNKFFLMQRKGSATEQRLKNKYTLGIGGHLREEDIVSNRIQDWIFREFEEEVSYNGSLSIVPLGIINDERDPVGQVHTGFAFLLVGSSDNISIRSELKNGQLLTIEECVQYYDSMESWSTFIIDYLRSNKVA